MTTAIVPGTSLTRGSFRRIGAVVKLHLTNPWTTIYLPWLIMAAILVLNLLIWWMVISSATTESARAEISDGMQYSGASSYFFVYMLVVAVQSINSYFPFALGYGVTRRDYYLGASATFILLSALYTLGLGLLALIEDATGGWGFGGVLFTVSYFGDGPLERLFINFVAFLFFFFVGSAIAAVYVRWKTTGMAAFFVSLAFVLVGLGAVVTLTGSWNAVGAWFAANGFLGTWAWSLVPTAIAAVTGYFILRGATPRS